jgi:hypothetical protein
MCRYMCPVIGGEAATRSDIKGKGRSVALKCSEWMSRAYSYEYFSAMIAFCDLLNCSKTINACGTVNMSIIKIVFVKLMRGPNSIANEMGIPRASVEAKIHNIRSQFMRERKKVQRSKTTGTGADDVYVPAWFAYPSSQES